MVMPAMSLLASISPEVFDLILSTLSNRDIKNLRLTSTGLAAAAHLRFSRVFLSPHPRDIAVLEAIAKHPVYREHVVELVYDDARFSASLESDEDRWLAIHDHPAPPGVPVWFEREYDRLLSPYQTYRDTFVLRPHHIGILRQLESRLSVKQSYRHYQKVVREQKGAMAAAADVKALEFGLARFTNLRRITVTPTAHGKLFQPRYHTPMIRSLPYGLVYPPPRGWPVTGEEEEARRTPKSMPWINEDEKNKWRGVCLLLRTLANRPHRITEFNVDVHQILTGLSCRIFDKPNQEYDNLVSLLRSPNFSHLHLALFLGDEESNGWQSLHSGLLRDALAEAKNLQHVSLGTGLANDLLTHYENFGAGPSEHSIPLRSIFPQTKHLQHFGLSRFIVMQNDVIEFLASLPTSLRSIDLSFLCFLRPDGGNYRDLIYDIRDKLMWHKRPASHRPRITVCLEMLEGQIPGWSIDISHEVESFVYKGAENPFQGECGMRIYREQRLGMLRYALEPLDDRPWTTNEDLVDLGIYKRDDRIIPGFTS
ncbi:hypothetical protein HJFPF1_05397 [Paramyrothecium foliicola]|nr:hypothetical protein HJFPF1_05397 [Paramyrothecium foliicola]